MDGYISMAGEQIRQHYEVKRPGGDREAWRLHLFLYHQLIKHYCCVRFQ